MSKNVVTASVETSILRFSTNVPAAITSVGPADRDIITDNAAKQYLDKNKIEQAMNG